MTHIDMIPPRTAAAILGALLVGTTAGPWEAFRGHVASTAVEPQASDEPHGRASKDSIEYYGGGLVAESCDAADALFIAAAHSLLPAVINSHEDLLARVGRLQMDLRLVRAEFEDAQALLALIRDERYQRPAFAVARRAYLDELRRIELENAEAAS
jgi:hypothetical protein